MCITRAATVEGTAARRFATRNGPLSISESGRASALEAKRRIGPRYAGPRTVAEFGKLSEEYVKKLLRPNARWSLQDLRKMVEALRRCERRRVECELAKLNECSVPELRRRIRDRIEAQKAIAKEKQADGSVCGGAIEAETVDEWIEMCCDRETCRLLSEAASSHAFSEILNDRRQRREAVVISGAPMLYQRERAPALAEALVQVLESRDLLRGAKRTRITAATRKLMSFFSHGRTTADADGFSRPFHEACTFEFLTTIPRKDWSRIEKLLNWSKVEKMLARGCVSRKGLVTEKSRKKAVGGEP